ncbi:MAG: hypothetical protein A2Y76_02710 [Planctomycetes bacterium RBG_13_60_9]|nr:MAG: hypothetical protein A2Y76_02710 [Planctomycetes bacterium RBG_13_60_9]
MAVPDVPRQWDFDVLPDTPGSSPYSTLPPPDVSPVPPQIELPPDYVKPPGNTDQNASNR